MQLLYRFFYTIHKNYSLKRQRKLPYKVISVGNITTGGTGKTPTVIAISEEILKRQCQPIILTRGYKGKTKSPIFVNKDKTLNQDIYCNHPQYTGDEPLLMSYKLPCVPVVKAINRYEGGIFALKHIERFKKDTGCNLLDKIIFIIDDGFQHWGLFRDLDIVVIDGLNPFGNHKLLPLGRLREPLQELKRADIFLITRCMRQDTIEEIRRFNNTARIYFAKMEVSNLIDMDDNTFPPQVLKDKRIFAFSGIGNNEQFKNTVKDITSKDIVFRGFKDHHNYTVAELIDIKRQSDLNGCEIILTTEKDMIKIKHLNQSLPNIYAVEIRFEIEQEFYSYLFT